MASTKASKEQKYDRQLRLWGDHGQEALENAHVCLINATATGTEILKNLVLPIGAFTIVDGHTVTGEDIGNFFLSINHIGKNRAHAATELLQELNSDVSGNFVEESPEKLLENNPEFFHRFTVVIGVHLPETCLRLGSVLWSASVPFLICKTYGLIGYMRLVVEEHTIESHPDNALEDLRLDQPFDQLRNHVASYDLESMDKKDHSHTPWVVIVSKYLEKWLSEHDGQLPKTYREKEAFRQCVREIRENENGVPVDEENFDEAIKNVNTALNPTKIFYISSPFWVMLRAVKEFVQNEGNGNLPVRGTIPDMIADSQKFINLQNYRQKAMQDAAAVSKHVESLIQSVGLAPESISDKDIKLFKHASFLRVVRCRSLAEEYSVDSQNKNEISAMDSPDSEMVFYLMLRAVDRFFQQHSRYPYNYQVEEDISKLKLCVTGLLQEYNLSINIKDDYVHECRYGATEPHTVAAFMGAAAQEAIKLITHQFVPFSNTYIYNAMSQTSATLQL
uniref:NEDD8-activating enzyme E1 regulatory subunit n=1 Tax=Periophthalmus magnuspinnatus TaxID=409849 RepID=A0A3B4AIT3_9GOBI